MESGPGDLPAALTVGWLCQSFSVVVRSSDRRRSFRQGVLLQFGLSRPGLRRLSDCLIRSGHWVLCGLWGTRFSAAEFWWVSFAVRVLR